MSTFACKTRDAGGATVHKTIIAESDREAIAALRQDGLTPISVILVETDQGPTTEKKSESPKRKPIVFGGNRVSRRELMRFTMQLSSTFEAGVTILSGLSSIREQTGSPGMSTVLGRVIADIEVGQSLSAAMAKHPKVFPEVYTNTIAAGERSGTVDEVLSNLAGYLEDEIELRSDVRSALMYPFIVVGVLTLAISVLVIFVVPRFAAFYSKFGSDLPLPTRLMINGSDLVTHYFPVFLLAAVGIGYGLVHLLRTESGRLWADRALLKVPIFGTLVQTISTLRVTQMLGLFTQSGFPLLEGLEVIARTAPNRKVRLELLKVADRVATGETLANSLKQAACFPPTVQQMIASGEMTGTLEKSCFSISKHYKRELKYQTKNLATAIEPIMTLVLAAIVLFVALAAFLPMWNMVSLIKK